jgi:hypothetical protein
MLLLLLLFSLVAGAGHVGNALTLDRCPGSLDGTIGLQASPNNISY